MHHRRRIIVVLIPAVAAGAGVMSAGAVRWGDIQRGAAVQATSGAAGWRVQNPLSPRSNLSAIACPSATVCFAVARGPTGYPTGGDYKPAVLTTLDAGSKWQRENIGSAAPLGIACPSVSVCFVPAGPRIIVTRDGGRTWRSRTPPVTTGPGDPTQQNARSDDIACPSITTCYVLTSQCLDPSDTVLITTGGGDTWTSRDTATATCDVLTSIACPSTSVCYAVGESDRAGRTTDAGRTWRFRELGLGGGSPVGIACPGTRICYVYTPAGVRATKDGGKTWTTQNTSEITADLVFALACPSSTVCFLSTYTNGHGAMIATTTDGGSTWVGHQAASPTLLKGIACANVAVCFAVGDVGTILATVDGGKTWTSQTKGTTNYLAGIACPSATVCYAVGEVGTIVGTSDGGTTWGSQRSSADQGLIGVACPKTTVCYAVGASADPDGSEMLGTIDGGRTWTVRSQGRQLGQLVGVACPSASLCYAVGDGGIIMTTGDGGHTWTSRTSGTKLLLRSIACASVRICSVVGGVDQSCEEDACNPAEGVILDTKNGGRTWRMKRLKDTVLSGLACPGTNACYAVGAREPANSPSSALYLVTRNGGRAWEELKHAPQGTATSIACPSTRICYAPSGTEVQGTTDAGRTWATVGKIPDAVRQIACASVSTCFIVGSGGVIVANNGLPTT